MKKAHSVLLLFILIILFENCTSSARIQGRYSNSYWGIASEELKIDRQTYKFEYFSKTEYGIRAYSAGTWTLNDKILLLKGYEGKNLKLLEAASKIENYVDGIKDKVVIQYPDDPLDTFTRVELIANEQDRVRVLGDTMFYSEKSVNTLQLKTYLYYEGVLLGTTPTMDTLYSSKIDVRNTGSRHNIITLSFTVPWEAFYRTKLIDTLTVKNNNKLVWHTSELKKIRE